jgi:hypothetical protein
MAIYLPSHTHKYLPGKAFMDQIPLWLWVINVVMGFLYLPSELYIYIYIYIYRENNIWIILTINQTPI